MPRATNQLDRSLAALTIGVQSGLKRRHQALSEASGEYNQQLQVPLHGQAGQVWSWIEKGVNFRLPFVNAQAQRPVPFSTPVFTHGVVFVDVPPKFVTINVMVVQWSITPRGLITGAKMRYGAQCADTDGLVPYSALVHLNFQGYATYTETSQEMT